MTTTAPLPPKRSAKKSWNGRKQPAPPPGTPTSRPMCAVCFRCGETIPHNVEFVAHYLEGTHLLREITCHDCLTEDERTSLRAWE